MSMVQLQGRLVDGISPLYNLEGHVALGGISQLFQSVMCYCP